MSAALIRGIGSLAMGGNTVTALAVDLPARRVGDIMIVWTHGANVLGSNGGKPDTPAGFEVLTTSNDANGFTIIWAARVLDAEANLTLTAGTGQNSTWSAVACVITNVTPATTWRDDVNFETGINFNDFDALTVSGNDRLIFGMFHAGALGAEPGVFGGPPGMESSYLEPGGNLAGIYWRVRFRTMVSDTSTPSLPLTDAGGWNILGLSIIGVDDTPLPALPQPGQLRLACAESYTARITGADYQEAIEVIGWSSIKWERILDEPSSASVVVPDILGGVACCISHGGIEPWRFGLVIERNDAPVWKGPIVSISRDPNGGTTTIQAQDILVRYMKRFAVRDTPIEWVNVDAGQAFAAIINTYARSSDDGWFVQCPSVFVGAGVTRHIAPSELPMAWDVMSELLGSAVDAFVANGVLYVWEPGAGWRYFDGFKRTVDGPYDTNYDLVFGLFTAGAFTTLPSWSVDGMSMENFIAIPSADTGQLGFRQIWTAESADSQQAYGVLDHMEPNTLNLPEDTPPDEAAAVLQARANTIRDLHSMPPVVISGGTLAEGAPVDIAGLIPGSIWRLDIFDACFGQLRTASRLKRVEVTASLTTDGLVESVAPTLFPPGFSSNEQNTT